MMTSLLKETSATSTIGRAARPARGRGRISRRELAANDPFQSMLDQGASLILEMGFDRVNVSHVLEAAGISRGTFYYHFRNMENLLQALVRRDFEALGSRLRELVMNREMTAVQKLNLFLGMAKNWETSSDQGIRMLLSLNVMPGNQVYGHCVWNWLLDNAAPLLENIVEDGLQTGEFSLLPAGMPHSDVNLSGLGRSLLILARDMTADVLEGLVQEMSAGRNNGVERAFHRAGLYEKAIAAFLGTEAGTLKIIYRNRLQKIVEYLSTEEGRRWMENLRH